MDDSKILIVEDSRSIQEYLRKTLDTCIIQPVHDGTGMWKVLQSFHPDLILMDIMLPGKSGLQLAEELMSNDDNNDIPIIFLTARTSSIDVEAGLSLGVEDYIKKPFDDIELKARIQSVIRRNIQKKELQKALLYDEMTGTFNRKAFFMDAIKRIHEAMDTNYPLSMALIDIDDFKNVNDTYGHQAGDFVLRNFATIVKESLDDGDTIGRYGGEEFIVLFLNKNRDDSLSSLQNSLKKINDANIEYSGKSIKITFSAGISDLSEIHEDDNILGRLIDIADERIYEAKRRGKNMIVSS
ncbi:MAG: diguanylate cyclase [Spirochaetota bacterium]